ncbi:neuronal acetylcholine receptor subunit alpha-5-like [Lineus longissimus]|uniref:neuronal acetylcholine receptor subunit alpha-5-like n=1 Tax=Lineus longissimus TaxID=88925 RepID=UPI002B4E0A9F
MLMMCALLLLGKLMLASSAETAQTAAPNTKPTINAKTVDAEYISDEHTLRQKLFANYDPDMPPFKSANDNLTLQFEIVTLKVADLDETKQTFTVDGWVKMGWVDVRLAWNATESKVNQIHVSPKKLWIPDISLFNNGDGNYSPHSLEHPALVFPTGYVLFVPMARHVSHCEMDIKRFPFDKQFCHLTFGSWTHDAHKLNVIPFKGRDFTVDTSYMMHHTEWELSKSNGTKSLRYYACCPETPYADVTFIFEFDRKSGFFAHVFISPAVVLAILIPFMFTMNHEYGEKTTLGAGIMICLVLMILIMENMFPSAMIGTPLLTQYYAGSFVLVAISIVLNICTNKMMRTRTRAYPNKGVSWFFIDLMGKFLCLNKDAYRQTAEEDMPRSFETELGDDMDTPRVQTIGKMKPAQLEWMMIGVVLDRLFFLIFLILVSIVTIAMLNN